MALAAACLWAQPAAALGLGRLTVQSALGEALKAEIEVTSITPEEAASLNLRIAPPAAYRAAGVEYNAALPSATVQIVKRADGRSVLRLVSDRAVLEPFVDVIVEANWNSGRLVREYTMLFDPPNNRLAAAPAPVVPPVASPAPAPAAAMPVPAPAPVAAAPISPPPPPAPMTRPAPPPRARALAAPSPAPMALAPAPGADTYKVKPGESLSRVAARTQRPGVSLDQMLVSLFRGNPQAFIAENINKLKAGAVLTVPSAEQAAQVAPGEAREIIIAQSTDFGAYRQKLAAGAGAAPAAQPARQAKGQVQAQVDDRKAGAAPAPDRLTLSQGSAKPAGAAVDKKDDQARLAELNRNVEDLKKLQGATATAPAAPQPAAPVSPAAAVVASAPGEARTATPAPASPASPVSPPAPGPQVAKPLPAPTPAAEGPGLLDSILDNSLLLPGAGVLVALLAGLGLYKLRGRKRKPVGETSFLESRLQPDSFFGASGGQRVDTRDAAPPSQSGNSSSMNYSMSQLDAIGDVDPVAEADVYLAYGRDLQAEEILKEAMRASPDRLAVRTKLLEVYAKRRDSKAFELLATQLFNLTSGQGEDWAKAQRMGLAIDADNALYQPGGAPEGVRAGGPPMADALGAVTQPYTEPPPQPMFEPAADATLDSGPDSSLDLDLDLDLDFTAPAPAASAPGAMETTQPYPQPNLMRLDQTPDDLPKTVAIPRKPSKAPPPSPAPAPAPAGNMLDFDLGALSEDQPRTITIQPPAPPGGASGFGDFDLGDAPTMPLESSALARKLELAEEFRQIGDLEGARDLLEEVLAKSEGALKTKAQGMLDQLARR